MATYHDMEPISLESTDALAEDGFVLNLASTCKVAKATAGQAAFGVNEVSTLNAVTGVAEANKQVAVVQSPRYAYVQYDVRGATEDFAAGELVSVKTINTAGCVTRHISQVLGSYSTVELLALDAEKKSIVGIAMEAVAWSSGTLTGKVKVRLLCPKQDNQ